jgi:hypothetical protein
MPKKSHAGDKAGSDDTGRYEQSKENGGGEASGTEPERFDPNNLVVPAAAAFSAGVSGPMEDILAAEGLAEAQLDLEERIGFGPWSAGVQPYSASDETVDRTNVVGTAISEKVTDHCHTGKPCIRVYVRKKTDPSRIREGAVPRSIGGVLTDVIPSGEIMAQRFIAPRFPRYAGRERPARGGTGIGPSAGGGGTLGCVCVADNAFCILSNNHVLAQNDRLPVGSAIIQPGRTKFEMGVYPRDAVGQLRKVEPVSDGGEKRVDAALAITDAPMASGVHKTYALDPNPMQVSFRLPVRKDGWMTGTTLGEISGIGARVHVNVGTRTRPHIVLFTGQLEIAGVNDLFSYFGDSGSLIVSDAVGSRFRPVGLLFAGDADNNRTWANPILEVTAALNIERFVNTRVY